MSSWRGLRRGIPPPLTGEGRVVDANLCASPSPQSKSAVADFDRFIEWPKPAYTRFRLGEGWGAGSGGCGTGVPYSATPTPNPSPQGGGEEFAVPPRRRLTPMRGTSCRSHSDGLDRFKFHVITTPPRPSVFGIYSA